MFAMRAKREMATPPPESELVRLCEHLFQISRAYRDEDLKMARRWRSNRSWYLSTGRDRGVLSPNTTYTNLIYEKCEKLFADVTEATPEANYRARTPEEVDLAEYMNSCVPGIWDDEDGDRKYRESTKSSIIYGNDFWKIAHDPGYGGRHVGVKIRRVPCYRIFPAPYATDIESAPWVIEVQPRSVDEIYNDYRVRVEPELEPNSDFAPIHEDLADPRSRSLTYGTNLGGSSQGAMFRSSFGLGPRAETAQAIVFQKELWIRDPATEKRYWIEPTKTGPEVRHGRDLLYPRGRCISWANGRLLYDSENPYVDGRFPYARFTDNPYPDFFWGLGEVPNLINLQLLHDDTVDTIRLIHAYMAVGRLIVDETTGLRDTDLGNDPGEVWWTKRATHDRVKWLDGKPPNSELYNHLAWCERQIDLLTGSFDVTRGVNPTGVTAARAVVALQRAAGIRVRGRMREMEDTMKEAFRMIGSRVQQFGPSRIDYIDKSGSYGTRGISEEDRFSPFDVKVDIVSNLDDLKALEFQKLLLLFNMGATTKNRLLKDSGLSSTQALLKELPQAEMEQAQKLMMMATAGGSPGGPPTVGQAGTDVSSTQKAVGRALRIGAE